jgi:hypothetical protein
MWTFREVKDFSQTDECLEQPWKDFISVLRLLRAKILVLVRSKAV